MHIYDAGYEVTAGAIRYCGKRLVYIQCHFTDTVSIQQDIQPFKAVFLPDHSALQESEHIQYLLFLLFTIRLLVVLTAGSFLSGTSGLSILLSQ
jgi:hypothetical protein